MNLEQILSLDAIERMDADVQLALEQRGIGPNDPMAKIVRPAAWRVLLLQALEPLVRQAEPPEEPR